MSGAATSEQSAGDKGSPIREEEARRRTAQGRFSRPLAAGVIAALVAHGALLLAIVLLDRPADFPEAAREIPVELVAPPVGPEKKTPEAPSKSGKPYVDPQAAPRGDGSPREARPQLSPAEQGGMPANQPPVAEPSPGASDKKPLQSESQAQTVASASPDIGTIGRSGETGAFLASPFGSGPETFHAVEVPLPGSDGDAMNYSYIVGGMLKRMAHPPEGGLKHGAKGVATVGFVLDQSGGVAAVVLLHSSGRADLDAESMAVVKRAAPFPPPPPGAQHSFVIEVAFGRAK